MLYNNKLQPKLNRKKKRMVKHCKPMSCDVQHYGQCKYISTMIIITQKTNTRIYTYSKVLFVSSSDLKYEKRDILA